MSLTLTTRPNGYELQEFPRGAVSIPIGAWHESKEGVAYYSSSKFPYRMLKILSTSRDRNGINLEVEQDGQREVRNVNPHMRVFVFYFDLAWSSNPA